MSRLDRVIIVVMSNPYTPQIKDLVTSRPNVFTYQDVADKFSLTHDTVRSIARSNNLQGYFLRRSSGGGIIREERTLQPMETPMRDATKEEQQRIERLLEKNGYRPNWSLSWVHLRDEDIKTTTLLRNPEEAKREEEWQQKFIESIKKKAPRYPAFKPRKIDDKHLHLIDVADHHLGKDDLLHSYSLELAKDKAIKSVQSLVNRGSAYNIDQFLFPVGNDVLHVDNKANTTTSGTPQQVNAHWTEMWDAGFNMYVTQLEQLAQVAPVHVVYNRANHAEHLEWTLVKAVQARLCNMKHITWDINRLDRSCYVYGNNFIGTVHGDKAKLDKLPLLFATEFDQEWAIGRKREIFVHHVHHGSETVFKPVKDHPGIRVNTLRSMSPTDEWHHNAGFTGVPRSIESYVFHKEYGRMAHLTCPY